ncbi:hypothetical protein MDOR_35220 [Mycolicibacterium doricum]|uniref:Uncharacterized protein n=1 Tax=Mycolicibacterium doricum TaxID=126673 RepID=A0A7I7VYW9_9MYCO|nr:hypothetical protein MDOR_35220 [Mycolicibacterium doricum]
MLDDIEFDKAGSPYELLQTKHHTRRDGPITAQAVDLWRTLNVWMDLPQSDALILRLVTTQKLNEASGVACLRAGEQRDTSAALQELLNAARESTNKASQRWRQKFIDLDASARIDLIDRIIIDLNSSRNSVLRCGVNVKGALPQR